MCEQHKRGSASKRGYNARWRRESQAYLDEHPLCVECEAGGRVVPAKAVDHIIPHGGNERLMWDQDNWQALCLSHHGRKSRAEQL